MGNEQTARDELDAMLLWDRMEACAGWEHAEVVELIDAAHLLTAHKPKRDQYSRVLPADIHAMLNTLEQTILLRQLPVFAAWTWGEYGAREPVAADQINPHTVLHSCTTVRTADLAAWCDARAIFHPWHNGRRAIVEAVNPYPPELRAAIEAFNAVHGDPSTTAKRSPKAALTAWLKANKRDLSANARERIATVANWQPTGGAPKTPGE